MSSINFWKTELYDNKLGFVSEFGKDVIKLLNPQEDEGILDLGCGTDDFLEGFEETERKLIFESNHMSNPKSGHRSRVSNRDILRTTDHRPYAMPKGSWVMKQIWHDLLFAHWPVNAEELKPLIPQGLELELWEGKAWISIVPFHMSGIRLHGLPPIPFTSQFPELNVRTYVTCNGKPGVYFLSLDATNRLAVETARALFHLPYMKARISVNHEDEFIQYCCERRDPRGREAVFKGKYRAADAKVFHADPGTIIHWLTERYCLYTSNSKGEILVGDIHHLPWDLQEAELYSEVNSMAQSHGIILPEMAPLLTFTKQLDVLIWPVKKV